MTAVNKKGAKLASQIKSLEFGTWLIIASVISLLTIGMALIAQAFLPPEIPLFYGNAQGADQLASKLALILPGGMAVVTQILNTVISLLTKDVFAKRVLTLAGLAFAVLAFITTLEIILLVGAL